MEERLKRRKLDALKRGVHRLSGGELLPLTTHVVGLGGTGAHVIARILGDLELGAPKLTALAIDIGDQDLSELRALAAEIPAERAEVTTVTPDLPHPDDLFAALEHHGSFLELEYPNYRWTRNQEAWLPRSAALDPISTGRSLRRSMATPTTPDHVQWNAHCVRSPRG